MRKIYFLLFTFFSLNTNAQTYTPLPDSGGVWVNEGKQYYLDQNWFPVYYNYKYAYHCTNGQDTLIGSHTYTKVDSCVTGNYHGAFRDSSGFVYYVPKDSTNEYLLYAFNVNVGDTLFDVWSESIYGYPMGLENHVVNQIDSMQIAGDWRTIIYSQEGAIWIEGVGNQRGLFMENWDNVSMYFIELYCHSLNGTKLYPNPGAGGCPTDLNVGETPEFNFDIKPNPFDHQLVISLNGIHEEVEIFIYDLSGKIHFQTSAGTGEHLLDLAFLKSGSYILKIQNERSFMTQKIIKL